MGAKQTNLMGFSLPHHGSPIGTRRSPVPPVGASSFFDSTMPTGVVTGPFEVSYIASKNVRLGTKRTFASV
jgi:hypothetical protein